MKKFLIPLVALLLVSLPLSADVPLRTDTTPPAYADTHTHTTPTPAPTPTPPVDPTPTHSQALAGMEVIWSYHPRTRDSPSGNPGG